MLNKLAKPFVKLVDKFYPDAMVFAFILTVIVMVMALFMTPAGPVEIISSWGNGLSSLLAFIAQMSIILLTGTALANTRPMKKGMASLASVPKGKLSAYLMTTLLTMGFSLIAWSIGLILGGIFARYVQYETQKKGIKLHFPLLVAAVYSGWTVWHMGLGGMCQLWVATDGNQMPGILEYLIPMSDTIGQGYNIVGIIICALIVPFLMYGMRPKDEDCVGYDDELFEEMGKEMEDAKIKPVLDKKSMTVGERLDNMRWMSIVLGILLVCYIVWHFATNGFDLSFNIINWCLLAAGLLLSDSLIHYVRLVIEAGKTVGPIILQYPLYAGIMGIMTGTGLAEIIAGFFVSISTPQTLGVNAFLAGGLLNIFVPSGGGQWAVQGPIFLRAAHEMGVPYHLMVNGVAYGDQWTNLIQPLWTLPLLSLVGLKIKHIMGYCFLSLIVMGIIFAITIGVLPFIGLSH